MASGPAQVNDWQTVSQPQANQQSGPNDWQTVTPQAQPSGSEPGLAEKAVTGLASEGQQIGEFGKGALKGLYQFGNNVNSALGINAITDKLTGGQLSKYQKDHPELFQENGTMQKAGAMVGRNAPLFMAPEAEGGMVSRALYNAAIGAIGGASDEGKTGNAIAGGVIGGVAGPLMSLMGKYARTLYSTAINPTKLDAKAATASTLLNGTSNDLVGRGVWAMSLRGLHAKLDAESKELGQKVESTINQLDKQGTLNFQTILQAAQGEIDKPGGKFGTVTPHTGKLTDATEGKYQAALDTMSHVIDMVNKDGQVLNGVTYKTAQFVRQQLDQALWGDKLTPDLKQEASKFSYYLANKVREEMNSNAPDLAAVNNDFHVIKTAVKAIGYTLERKTGQQGVATKLDSMIGEQLGSLMGHPLAGLAVGAAQKSTAYRTGGAVLMDRAAKHSAKASAALGKFAADQWNKIQIGDSEE